jgi:predicted component of type VI protein secretion system
MRIDEIMNAQLKLELLRTIDKAIDKTIWNAYDSANGIDSTALNLDTDANVAATTVKQAAKPIAAQQQKPVKKLTPQQSSDIKTLNPQQLAQYIKTNLSAPATTPATANISKVPNKPFDTINTKNTAAKNKMDNGVEPHS